MGGNIVLVFLLIIFLTLINKRWGVFLSIVAILWLFSFRTNEIPDTEVYQWMYDDPISRIGYNEIGYLLIGYIFKTLTNADFIVYYLTLIGACCLLWYYGTHKLLSNNEHWGILFLTFISFFGFLYLGVLIRNGISEIIVLCGLSLYIKNKQKGTLYFTVFVILATFIHKSSIFFLMMLPLFRMKLSNKTFYRFFILCVLIWLVSGVGLARDIIAEISKLSMFSDYDKFATSTESSPNMFSLQVLISVFISYCAITNKKNIHIDYKYTYNCFLIINMIGLLVLAIIWSLPTSYRFYNMFFFFNYILIYLMIFHNIKIRSRKRKIIYSLSINIIYFFILIHSFSFLLLY